MSTIADMLSKCQLEDAKDLMGDSVFGKYSSTFVSWLANPSTTRGLGIAIVTELSELGGNKCFLMCDKPFIYPLHRFVLDLYLNSCT